PELVSQLPGTRGLAGTESLSSTSATIRSTEKMIPATAAARGVLSGLRACSGPWSIADSVMAGPRDAPCSVAILDNELAASRSNHPERVRRRLLTSHTPASSGL